jgi:hypothetical protein
LAVSEKPAILAMAEERASPKPILIQIKDRPIPVPIRADRG